MATQDKTLRTLTSTCGWSMDYHVDASEKPLGDGGIVLSNVKHKNYPLASDVRVLGFWVTFKRYQNKSTVPTQTFQNYYPLNTLFFEYKKVEVLQHEEKFDEATKARMKEELYRLLFGDSSLFPQANSPQPQKVVPLQKPQENTPRPEYTKMLSILEEISQFKTYSYLKGLRTNYTLLTDFSLYGSSNVDISNMTITQTFLFSKYGNDPAHEPSGGLSAARIFPLIKFEFKSNPLFTKNSNDYFMVESIRADYRIEYNLLVGIDPNDHRKIDPKVDDEFFDMNDEEYKYIVANRPQQAGLFTDIDSGMGAGSNVFDAAEKPIKYEVVGDGLKKEFQQSTTTQFHDANYYKTYHGKYWDNVHWWGGYKDFHIINAPGGFHAAHLHWRWGKTLQESSMVIPHAGEGQFKSSVLGGELVDPAISKQNIKFAIVKKEISSLRARIEDYDWYFKSLRNYNNPAHVSEGAPLVLHISFTAIELTKSSKGTFFIHGIFFAHDKEPDFWGKDGNPIAYLSGDNDRLYKNPSSPDPKQWVRNPIYTA